MEVSIKITSEDKYSSMFKMWFVSHTLYVDGENVGESSSVASLLEDEGLSDFLIADKHTAAVLSGDYSSEWISKRYAPTFYEDAEEAQSKPLTLSENMITIELDDEHDDEQRHWNDMATHAERFNY